MGGVLDWSTTPGSNTTVDGVNIAEGMQAGLVNNGMRAIMALVREWQLDASGVVTAGAGNDYTITSNQGIAAYADGLRFSFRADRNNTGASTLNVDGRGAKALRKTAAGALTALAADDIVAEAVYDVVYDVSSDVFVIVGFSGLQASAFMKTVLDDATAADARTTLGLVIGTDVQAQGATLTSLEGLTLAEGDILYATGADTLARLAKGAAGQVLRQNAGLTAPEWATSGTRVLLATKTASASATLDFTEFANATYSRYWFRLKNVKPATNNVTLNMRLSTDAGASYDAGASDYSWTMEGSGDAIFSGQDQSDSAMSIASSIGNAADEDGVSGDILLMNAPSATARARIRADITYDNTSGINYRLSTSGKRLADQDTTAVRFLFSAGNIASGVIEMWGEI